MEEKLSNAFADEPVPPSLWPRIQSSLEQVEAAEAPPIENRRWQWSARAFLPIAAMLLLVVGIAGLVGRSLLTPQFTASEVALVPINEFRTFEASRRPLDFASVDPAKVRDWFRAKMALPLPAPVAATGEASLTGGRLCYFFDRRVASFMYGHDGRQSSLYVMAPNDLPVEPGHAPQVIEDGPLSAVVWSDGSLTYVLVSTLSPDRARDMVNEVTPTI